MRWIVMLFGLVGAAWCGFLGVGWNEQLKSNDMRFVSGFAQLRNDNVGQQVQSDLAIVQHIGTALLLIAVVSLLAGLAAPKLGRIVALPFLLCPLILITMGILQSLMPMDIVLKASAAAVAPSVLAGFLALFVRPRLAGATEPRAVLANAA